MSYEKDVQMAKDTCLRLLTYRPRTEYEMRCHLRQRGFGTDVINETIFRLSKVGLINDELFARDWVRWRLNAKPVGREYIRYELRQKGVDNAIIEDTLRDYGDGDELEMALVLARKRAGRCTGLTRRKLAGYLSRRGFSPGVVTTVCNTLADNGGLDIS
ncbi:regulatory protein RecX [Desulfallas thermosapovorans]|uniref:Regulatory protein RecX n=1 Tax=Desulfallas thermosapovorans DSM 6562 TaxID=1121431 RepID=A0A5S4ZYB9_9FIRM|nr:regulatory protein RecX [Desulfallas thermosapovorans]TYO97855.1 regulatory protein [Desulfallas thermosapovorans DSM 6562]